MVGVRTGGPLGLGYGRGQAVGDSVGGRVGCKVGGSDGRRFDDMVCNNYGLYAFSVFMILNL